ncbi:MAG: OmpA family protein [Zoogloea sp.]|uniref:OmpA family protein n=1 Tax=Zoogloea sp. TaxID=49181 RepID=UPI00263569C6|nr:OmpA family protein [Zoogloea sp.]MDD2991708.1 OmpA family protein [Zoogloea sp.]
MKPTSSWLRTRLSIAACALLVACATPPQATTTKELPFEQAVAQATEDLFKQTQADLLSKVESKLVRRTIAIDPLLDGRTGQQTAVTRSIEKSITEKIKTAHPQFDVLPFQSSSMGKTSLILTGTLTRDNATGTPSKRLRLALALTDLKTGKVIAQANSLTRDDGLDTKPTPFYQDSPVIIHDRTIDGYVKTAETPPGQAADPAYLEKIVTAALIEEALGAYNDQNYAEALHLYQRALASSGGDQLRVHTGIYLSNLKLGRNGEAEAAFGKIVSSGLANNNLGVKFLFRPGSTEFWQDTKISGPYTFWLRQIARQSAAAKVCMNIIGHTSKTGSEQTNDRLSQQRAQFIKQRLEAEAPELGPRTRASGQGFRQALVGTGSDDARDALDRRVEFKLSSCPP